MSSLTLNLGDETAIRALIEQMIDGWNKGSGNAFATPFDDDADFVGFDGTHLKGRQEIALFHQDPFDKYLKGSRLVWKLRSARLLTPDVAIINAISGTVMPGQKDLDTERNSVQTYVAVKRNGDWRLTAFQNSRAQFIGRPEQSEALTKELRQLLGLE
jgi:uncharacterized protein (TIGR02246 family)